MRHRPNALRIVSGGQTGVDRAALDVALARGTPCGGWCPKGRRAFDGPIDPRYPLEETPRPGYGQRTRWNVRDSDGTLILARGGLAGGTALTAQFAHELARPCHVVDLRRDDLEDAMAAVRSWLIDNRITVLNVAGPRESSAPGIHDQAAAFLERLLALIEGPA